MRRAVVGGNAAERIYLDGSGNVTASVREDGSRSATWHRDASGALRRYEIEYGGRWPGISGSFRYGPQGELVAARISSADRSLDLFAELEWKGTFSRTAGLTRPFAGLGGAGGAENTGGEIELLSANLNVRHASNPMAPIRFTGTVRVTYPGQQGTDHYEYRDGRLVSLRTRGGSKDTFKWSGEDLDGSPSGDLTFDGQRRIIAGRHGERADATAWSDCPVH